MEKNSLREVSRQSGVPLTTLSRWKNEGKLAPDIANDKGELTYSAAPAVNTTMTIETTAEIVTLDVRANRIRRLQADVQRGVIEIGFELIAAKKEVGHGNWERWLQ